MESLKITSPQTAPPHLPSLLFICETELTIPYMTYQIKDNRVYVTMRCNTLNPHVETIRYEEYKSRNSGRFTNSQWNNKCVIHTTEDSVCYCHQHKQHWCSTCKECHIKDYPTDLIWPINLNVNLHCKEHPSDTLISHCQQCNINNICTECAENKGNNHPALNIKHWMTKSKINKIKDDFNTYEKNYFHEIHFAYTQAQQELKNDYENHIRVNTELFGIVRNILDMSDMFKDLSDVNLFHNFNNIVNNLRTGELFHYQPGNINELKNYLKTNLVLNIDNIKDLHSTTGTGPSSSGIDSTWGSTRQHIKEEVGINTPPKTRRVHQQETNWIGSSKKFEWITTIKYQSYVFSLCKLNDDLYAAGVGCSGTYTIHIVEYSNNRIIHSLTGHTDGIWKWYRHKKSDLLVSWSFDSDIRVWNYSTAQCFAVLKGHCDDVNDIVESGEGDIITVSDDRSIKYWNMDTFHCYKTIEDAHNNSINSVLLLNSGQWITGGGDKQWKIWKVDANKTEDICNSITTDSVIRSWLEVGDARWCAGLSSGEIWVYDINGFTLLGKLRQHSDSVNIMVLLSNGTFISGSEDSKLIIWDVNSWSCLQKLEEHASYIATAWIEIRENEILSGSRDETVKKWVRRE